jgi:hypothetical protein
MPVPLVCVGMLLDQGWAEPELVGVAVFSVPARPEVLTNPLPTLTPLAQSCELGRLVLLGEPGQAGGKAPANSETWFLKRALRIVRDELGIQAVISFSDPCPRTSIDGAILFPGHYGCVYQSASARELGRSKPRPLTLLPDGRVLSDRAISKVRAQDKGHAYVERLLISYGASPRIGGDPKSWLIDALNDVRAIRMRHPGNIRYGMPTSPAARRALGLHPNPQNYPKPDQATA